MGRYRQRGSRGGTHRLGQVARALRGVEDLVVEHGEVERETQADGVGRRQVLVCQLGCGLVGVESVGRASLAVLRGLELGKIPVTMTSHERGTMNFNSESMSYKSTVLLLADVSSAITAHE